MTKKSVDLLKSIWLLVRKVFLMTNKLLKLVTIILIKKSLTLLCDPEHLNDVSDENDPIKIAMKTFKDHPSIVNINKNIPKTETFTFNEIEADLIKKMIDNLDARKSEISGAIPANCLKGVSYISANFFHTVSNDEVLKDLKYPSELKLADVVPAFKSQLLPAFTSS